MPNTEPTNDAVYFLSLSLENVRCFGSRQTLDLSDRNGRPAQWTVILGDNGTGKTTLLQAFAGMESNREWPYDDESSKYHLSLKFGEFYYKLFRDKNKMLQVESKFYFGSLAGGSPKRTKIIDLVFEAISGSTFTSGWDNASEEQMLCKVASYVYGANRSLGKGSLHNRALIDNIKNLFDPHAELINAEEWLLQADYLASKESEVQAESKLKLQSIKQILIHLLPEVEDIRIQLQNYYVARPSLDKRKPNGEPEINVLPCFLPEFKTPDGWISLNCLSLGYQTMIAWMVDLAAHLFQRYPNSPNPIAEPAVVLIDEIDLHLHPKWQRTIMSYLSERFTNTQFIVTAHSPLIVQAAENANIVVLKREGDEVHSHQHKDAVRGWRIDQILNSDLFEGIGARSPQIQELLEERRKLLSKPKLTKKDKEKLAKLEAEIGDLPTAETPEDIQAMDIIRRAAELLKSGP